MVDERSGIRVGVATDLGRPTAQIRHALSGCDLLVLEANHDDVMLRTGPYPAAVKQRIASSHGHLRTRPPRVWPSTCFIPGSPGSSSPTSRECNRPLLAERVVGDALRKAGWQGHLEVATQDRPTALLDVEELRYRAGPSQLSLL